MNAIDHMTEGASDFLAQIARLPAPVAATAERLFWWERDDLRRMASKLRLGSAYFASVEKKSHAAIVIDLATRYVDAFDDDGARNVSIRVATFIENRWYDQGFSRWVRNDRGIPIARTHGATCTLEYAFLVSPSGKTLFRCHSCNGAPTPSPGLRGSVLCDGRSSASWHVADALVAGVRYTTWKGIPEPTISDLSACRRCWRFGLWSKVDTGAIVCDDCARKAPERYPT